MSRTDDATTNSTRAAVTGGMAIQNVERLGTDRDMITAVVRSPERLEAFREWAKF